MKTLWAENGNDVEHSALSDKLHRDGIFEEADALFDIAESGENPVPNAIDPNELVRQLKRAVRS